METELDRFRPDAPFVLRFDDPDGDDRSLVGGKGANLARLADAGLPVPDGFFVTTTAYRALVDDVDLRARIASLDDVDPSDTDALRAAGEAVRDRILERPVPPAVRVAIADALDAVGPDEAYAVRSSATAEDLPTASYAGQQETVLNVRGVDAVVDATRECMASLFTDRAIAYRARNGVSHAAVGIAVVVQRMVDPDASGVLFTADPVTGDRTVATVEASFGLGEALVQGTAPADRARVDARSGEVLSYDVAEKRVTTRPLPGGGTETVDLPPDERDRRVLSDAEARELARIGRRVETLFDAPQDVEWAREGGHLFVLQARPVTSLFPVPAPEPDDDRLHVYYSWGHKEAMPDAMPPLVLDVWTGLMRRVGDELGLGALLGPWIASAGGRIYQDLTPFLRHPWLRARMLGTIRAVDPPAAAAVQAALDEHDPFADVETGALSTLRGLATVLRHTGPVLARLFAGIVATVVVSDPTNATSREREWYDEYGAETVARIQAGETPAERARVALDELDRCVVRMFERLAPLYAALVTESALKRLCPGQREDVGSLAVGVPGDVVIEMTLALGDLADVARKHPAVADAIREGASRNEIRSVRGGSEFDQALEEFLDEFGFRGPAEIDLSKPRWREDPRPVLQIVRGNLARESAGGHRERFERLAAAADAAADRLEVAASRGRVGFLRAAVVRRLARVYRGYIGTREHPKYGITIVLAEARDQLLDAGRTLSAQGRLDAPEDVWFLHLDELRTLLDDPEATVDADVEWRRDAFERYAEMDPPVVITSDGEVPTPPARPGESETTLLGTGVSNGVVEGEAVVVDDPTEAVVEPGQILVARYCDPGWTPLFLNAAGMVTEVGGLMTHGSLVAREYGIPGVVSVTDATRRIRTGQRLRVDGSRGVVELLDDG